MRTATNDLPVLTRLGDARAVADSGLFSLMNELRQCEKRRDDLLDRLSSEESDQVKAAAKTACDDARAVYDQIAAIKPTTAAGVLRQLELAARGWVAPSTVSIAISALREIVDRPPPFKAGRLPAVPATKPASQRAGHNSWRPAPHSGAVHSGAVLGTQA